MAHQLQDVLLFLGGQILLPQPVRVGEGSRRTSLTEQAQGLLFPGGKGRIGLHALHVGQGA